MIVCTGSIQAPHPTQENMPYEDHADYTPSTRLHELLDHTGQGSIFRERFRSLSGDWWACPMPEKFSVSIGIIRGSPGRWRAKTLSMYTTRQSSVFGYIGTFDTITSSTAYVVLMSFWIFTSEADNFCPRRQQNIRNKIPPTVFRARPSSKTPLTPRPTLLRPGADQMLI